MDTSSNAVTKQFTYEEILNSIRKINNLPPRIDYIKVRQSYYIQLSKEVGYPLAGKNDSVNHLYGCQYKVVPDDAIESDIELIYLP